MTNLKDLSDYIEIFDNYDDVIKFTDERKENLRKSTGLRDTLTTLYTKNFFLEYTNDILNNSTVNSFSLIMLDIDNLKHIISKFGSDGAEIALSSLGNICKNCTKHSDIFARYRGDQLCCFLPNTNFDNAMKIGEKIRKSVELRDFIYNNISFNLTVSVGVVYINEFDPDTTTIEQCIEIVYKALNEAKIAGKNTVVGY